MSAAGLRVGAPTGKAPSLPEVVTDACDLISEAPATHLHRATLHGVYRAACATSDAAELAHAIGRLREVAAGRDVTCEDFDAIRASALEIASMRGRRRA